MSTDPRVLRERLARERNLSASWEATAESLIVLVVALGFGLFGGAVHCYEYTACHQAGTCSNASRGRVMELSCAFYNHVTVSGDVLYGKGNQSSYQSLTQSVCAPGERLHINSVTTRVECAPWRSWPNALNAEIMRPGAAAVHDQVCGAWIDAGPMAPAHIHYWSFYDGLKANAAVRNAELALYSSTRLSATDMGKFYTSCQHAILGGSGAIRSSAKAAYDLLKTGLSGLITERRVLEAAGFLSSYHCDAPAQLGVTVQGGILKATVFSGSAFNQGVLSEALYAVEESNAMQGLAEQGNDLLNANRKTSPMATLTQLEYAFEGATGRTDHDSVPLQYGVTPELDGLAWMVSDTRSYYAEAGAYLHGVAALCSFALQGSMTLEAAGDWSTAKMREQMTQLRAAKPSATALGRLKGTQGTMLVDDPSNVTVAEATTVTWSQLQAEPVGNPAADCPALARFLFPDRLDEEHFSLMITNDLYERFRGMTEVLRESVAWVVENNAAVNAVFVDAAAVASTVRSTTVRIAGAPRGTWAGIQRGYSDGHLESTDGPMLMALKQSQAIFTDRINLLFDNANPCTAPAVYSALEANAYIYPGKTCTHMLLGVLRKPMADERYDNTSLATRAGYVMSHELAHNTLNSDWHQGPLATLLSQYSQNYYSEAIADVVSALAIVHSGYATAQQACHHISQLWCARVPLTWSTSTRNTHPGPNERGDKLCQTLVDMGLM